MTKPSKSNDQNSRGFLSSTMGFSEYLEKQNIKPEIPSEDVPTTVSFESRYQIGDKLGQGGMGEVLSVYDRDLKRNVAMKRVPFHLCGNFDLLNSLLSEAQITARLEHPNIVPIYDLGRDFDNQLFYTMKKIEGISLGDVLDGLRKGDSEICKQYTLSKLLRIFIQVCQAMALSHQQGILHRDLKPDNIMLGYFGEVMVVDWGIALDYQEIKEKETEEDSEGGLTGTVLYMSPEQINKNTSELDSRSDIYTLGVILFEIVSLQHPIKATNATQALSRIISGEYPSLSEFVPQVPIYLEKIVEKAMSFELKDRYQKLTDFIEDLELFIEDATPRHISIPLGKRIVSFYFGRQEFIKRLTTMDVDFIGLSGMLFGLWIGATWHNFYGNLTIYCFILSLVVFVRPLWSMLFAKQSKQFLWFTRLHGKFAEKSS